MFVQPHELARGTQLLGGKEQRPTFWVSCHCLTSTMAGVNMLARGRAASLLGSVRGKCGEDKAEP